METTNCAAPDLNDLAGAYVASRLTEAELEQFEQHLLGCAACQADVRTAAELRVAASGRRMPRWVFPVSLATFPALAAAAVIVLVLSRDPFAALGRIDAAAPFQGMAVRAAAGPLLVIDSALAAYAREDYRTAERQLARASAGNAEPGVQFFLGVSRLMLGRPSDALAPLAGALDPEDNPYAPEARYYLAKAFLQLGQPDSAVAYLRLVSGDTSSLARQARALLVRIDQARR